MNNLHHGGLMRCCVQDFESRKPSSEGMDLLFTSCCGQFIERMEDGNWRWVGAERQQEREERE